MRHNEHRFLGIDVSKDWFDADCLGEPGMPQGRFDQSPEGFRRFASQMSGGLPVLVAMEATGGYERNLAEFLRSIGAGVAVLDGRRVAKASVALGRRNKTDGRDAAMLALYAQRFLPQPTPACPELRIRLGSLDSGAALAAKIARKALNAAGGPAADPAVRESMGRIAEFALKEQERLEALRTEAVRADAGAARKLEMLQTVPGVGERTASRLLSLLPADLRDARSLCAYAGLAPTTKSSGSSVRGRSALPKACRRDIRALLYLPAMAAIRHYPEFAAFRDRLVARGKAKKQAIMAAARKILTAVWAVLAKGETFDMKRLFAT